VVKNFGHIKSFDLSYFISLLRFIQSSLSTGYCESVFLDTTNFKTCALFSPQHLVAYGHFRCDGKISWKFCNGFTMSCPVPGSISAVSSIMQLQNEGRIYC